MYTSFFGLNEKPFAITPDPRYLYLSERHAEALAHLLYGINEAGGFIQLACPWTITSGASELVERRSLRRALLPHPVTLATAGIAIHPRSHPDKPGASFPRNMAVGTGLEPVSFSVNSRASSPGRFTHIEETPTGLEPALIRLRPAG